MALQTAILQHPGASRHRARTSCSCLCHLTTQETQHKPAAANALLSRKTPSPTGASPPHPAGSGRRAGPSRGQPGRGVPRKPFPGAAGGEEWTVPLMTWSRPCWATRLSRRRGEGQAARLTWAGRGRFGGRVPVGLSAGQGPDGHREEAAEEQCDP